MGSKIKAIVVPSTSTKNLAAKPTRIPSAAKLKLPRRRGEDGLYAPETEPEGGGRHFLNVQNMEESAAEV